MPQSLSDIGILCYHWMWVWVPNEWIQWCSQLTSNMMMHSNQNKWIRITFCLYFHLTQSREKIHLHFRCPRGIFIISNQLISSRPLYWIFYRIQHPPLHLKNVIPCWFPRTSLFWLLPFQTNRFPIPKPLLLLLLLSYPKLKSIFSLTFSLRKHAENAQHFIHYYYGIRNRCNVCAAEYYMRLISAQIVDALHKSRDTIFPACLWHMPSYFYCLKF